MPRDRLPVPDDAARRGDKAAKPISGQQQTIMLASTSSSIFEVHDIESASPLDPLAAYPL